MEVRSFSVDQIAKIICGDMIDEQKNTLGIYLSGPKIVQFLCDLGLDKEYKDFGTRYAELSTELSKFFKEGKENSVFNAYYALLKANLVSDEIINSIFEKIDVILSADGYKIIRKGSVCTVVPFSNGIVVIEQITMLILSTDFLEQQIDKCKEKILNCDFDGSITNARSMVEEVLLEIEKELTGTRGENDGDVAKIYNRVKKLLNLSPDMPRISTSLKQIMSGLISVVSGLGSLRSKISDSHAPEYRAQKHHALLCVNCAMTMAQFLLSTFEYQKSKKKLPQ